MYIINNRVAMIAGKENKELRTIASQNSWLLVEPGPVETLVEKTARRRVQVVVVHVTSTDDPGLKLIRKLSTHWRPPHCLVVALISQASLEQAALAAGANCYLTQLTQLQATVSSFLDLQNIEQRGDQENLQTSGRGPSEPFKRWKNTRPNNVVVGKNLRS